MKLIDSIKSIMSKEIIAVKSSDSLQKVAKMFNHYKIHHLLVIDDGLVGIISITDYLLFKKGYVSHFTDKRIELFRHKKWLAEDIMTTKIATLKSDDKIQLAVDKFKANLFHAIPIVDDNKPVGILTPYDIISNLTRDRAKSIAC